MRIKKAQANEARGYSQILGLRGGARWYSVQEIEREIERK
jgi:hypothetical protein